MNVKLFLCLNGNNVAYVWLVSFSQFYLLVGGRGSFAADLSGEAHRGHRKRSYDGQLLH